MPNTPSSPHNAGLVTLRHDATQTLRMLVFALVWAGLMLSATIVWLVWR